MPAKRPRGRATPSDPELLLGPSIPIPDANHPDGICWRLCQFTYNAPCIVPLPHYGNIERPGQISVRIRRKPGGRPIQDLFDDRSFIGCLDHTLESMLMKVLPRYQGEMQRQYPLSFAGSRSASDNVHLGRSPSLSFALPKWLCEDLSTMSAHDNLALIMAARQVARDARARRAAPPR